MTLADDALRRGSEGFEGGIAGLGLSDLLQLNARNRFSGCFRIEHEGAVGVIFFRDGEIIHAERGEQVGEEAFREILAWPRGRFSVEPNVVAARRTIQKSCEHLLLDALRVVDERRSGLAPKAPAQAASPASAGGATAAVEAARQVPGVVEAVLVTRDGKRASEGGYEAEVAAGQAAYVAMMAAELGALSQRRRPVQAARADRAQGGLRARPRRPREPGRSREAPGGRERRPGPVLLIVTRRSRCEASRSA